MTARTGAATIVGLVFLAISPAHAQSGIHPFDLAVDPQPATDTDFEVGFTCPEALANDGVRRAALVEYFHWVAARHPDWTTAEAVEFRKTMMVRHQCGASLRDLANFTKRQR